jgi:hypothetical protein
MWEDRKRRILRVLSDGSYCRDDGESDGGRENPWFVVFIRCLKCTEE